MTDVAGKFQTSCHILSVIFPKTLLPMPVEGKAIGTLHISRHGHGQGRNKAAENVPSLMPTVLTASRFASQK